MNPKKIIKIVGTVREGVSAKTNKPYSILLVQTEDGDEVEVFGPAKAGDMVSDITFNDQYNKLQGKVQRPDKQEEIMAALKHIYAKLSKLEALVHATTTNDTEVVEKITEPPVKRDYTNLGKSKVTKETVDKVFYPEDDMPPMPPDFLDGEPDGDR